MKVLILAAGYGTRLKELGEDQPKPLLPIAGRPLLDYVMKKIRTLPGLQEVLIVTNDKFDADFREWARAQDAFPAAITVINDGSTAPENRLGSVGDLNYVLEHVAVDDDLLVLGGDNLFDFDLEAYLAFARERAPQVCIGAFNIHNKDEARLFGVVALDGEGKVTSFEEKPQQPKSSLIAMCFYHFPRPTLGYVQEYLTEVPKADKAGDYIRWLAEKKGIFGFEFTGKWYDIGSIESYRTAEEAFRQG